MLHPATSIRIVTSCFSVLFVGLIGSGLNGQNNWPQFRGDNASGISTGNPPIEWNLESGKNVKWQVDIPGLGHSSPVIWESHVYLTTAVSSDTDEPSLKTGWLGGTGKAAVDSENWTWKVLCLNRDDGSIVWSKDVAEGNPQIKRHLKASHANCTVAANADFVVAFFGSEGLFCFDHDGELKWKKDLGRLHSGPYNAEELEWGFASSPVIFEDRVIVQCDCLNTGFVSILDIANGDEMKRIKREEVATWSTPTVVETDSGTQLVCNGYKQMASYDFETGDLLWTLKGGGDVPVPTPLFANQLIYLTNGHGRSPTYAIRPDARGDLTPPEDKEKDLPEGLVWWQGKDGSYMPTPIVVGERLYTCNDNGRLAVRNALTGELIYKKRVGEESGTYSASAVATESRLYFSSEKGIVTVIKTGDEYDQLASNEMDVIIMATPAISGDQLFIRTSRQLLCLEAEQ